ncbi:hypothetical protein LCGC14_1639320 [marine sediment metagenome]|uniref:Uncharacterized protein n=1 Tax=marine sediment metagenome TaxID=412755 RepID=A0A0F9IMP1_9ZZZZ
MSTKLQLKELAELNRKRVEKIRKQLADNIKKANQTRIEQKAEQYRYHQHNP